MLELFRKLCNFHKILIFLGENYEIISILSVHFYFAGRFDKNNAEFYKKNCKKLGNYEILGEKTTLIHQLGNVFHICFFSEKC